MTDVPCPRLTFEVARQKRLGILPVAHDSECSRWPVQPAYVYLRIAFDLLAASLRMFLDLSEGVQPSISYPTRGGHKLYILFAAEQELTKFPFHVFENSSLSLQGEVK